MKKAEPQIPENTNTFWTGLILGGVIGALLVALFGTERGRRFAQKLQEEGVDLWDETKDAFQEKTEEVSEKVGLQVEKTLDQLEDRAEVLEDKGAELIEKGKELLKEGERIQQYVVEEVKETKEELVDQVVAKADETLAHIEALQERGRQSTADLRKKLFKNIPKKTS